MFGLSPLGLFFLIIVALIVVGPRLLPDGIEALWLAVENLRRSQRQEGPLELEEARRIWKQNNASLFNGIEMLRMVVEHLEELRSRTFHSVMALVVGTVICIAFYNQIYAVLLRPISGLTVPPAPGEPKTNPSVLVLNTTQTLTATVNLGNTVSGPVSATITLPAGTRLSVDIPREPERIRPVFLKPTEMFITTFKVAILGGLALALPFILYEVLAFIWPALEYPHEKRMVYALLPFASVFFVGGVLFCYFFMLPFALRYLLTFGGGVAQALPAISDLISFMVNLMFFVGLSFETPLAVFFLAKAKIVSYQRLRSMWKYAFLFAFVVGAIITPTPDPINQAIVSIPIFLLYLLGVILARFA